MKKRLITVALAAIMAVLSAFAFVGCSTDEDTTPPDTFYTGTLSSESYDSTDAAAQAFLMNEVAGDVTNAVFESYDKQADLTEAEIESLNLTDAQKENVEAAEKGVVNYTEAEVEEQSVYASAAVANTKTVKVYVIRINLSYYYYAPSLENGDVLTKAYFDEVFDESKYLNCTINLTSNTTVTARMGSMSQTQSMKVTGSMKIDGKYALATFTFPAGLASPTDMKMEMFFIFDENQFSDEFELYISYDGEWFQSDISFEEIGASMSVKPENDYSFFVKTRTGFKLNSEKFNYYLEQALGGLGEFGSVDGLDMNSLTANAEYFVQDGYLTKTVATVSVKIAAEGGITGTVKSTVTQTYSAFGTTTVTVPDGIEL